MNRTSDTLIAKAIETNSSAAPKSKLKEANVKSDSVKERSLSKSFIHAMYSSQVPCTPVHSYRHEAQSLAPTQVLIMLRVCPPSQQKWHCCHHLHQQGGSPQLAVYEQKAA